jgi:hypothetical protein
MMARSATLSAHVAFLSAITSLPWFDTELLKLVFEFATVRCVVSFPRHESGVAK